MPELPEVETVARGLNVHLRGETIKSVEVLRDDSIAYPSPDQFRRHLKGLRFDKVFRRGKYILCLLEGGAGLAAHLRMSGRLIISRTTNQSSFLRVRMKLMSGRELRFEDMRVFGRLWFVPRGKSFEEVIPALSELGVEPLEDMDSAYLKRAFQKKMQPIKSALLDQRLIAGIGNIYADEALFRAGVHPLTPAGKLNAKQLETLCRLIKETLSRAIELGGSTLRDYTDSMGVNGNYQNDAWVYGRKGDKCRICANTVERVKIAGRSSHFCPSCQPLK